MPLAEIDGSRESIEAQLEGRHPATVSIARYFAYSHLKTPLRGISAACATMALNLIGSLPDGPELTTGLRKLLEAKDCFVRAALDTAQERVR
jgi:hypothetical protein